MSRTSKSSRVLAAAVMLLGTIVALPSQTASAAGSPDISLVKDMPARALAGDPAIPVTLTATNPDTVDGYNLAFKDVLEVGATFVAGTPAPTTILADTPSAGETTLLWENISDLPPGSSFSVDYTYTSNKDVGGTVTNDASAYVSSNPRLIPKFDANGAPTDSTGSDADSQTTDLVAFLLDKEEGSTEEELMRGLHDHQTAYTLQISNNFLNDSTGFAIEDWVPAGMEFLACGGVDNSSGPEYPGSGPINPGNAPALANPCVLPTSVATVDLDPDGPGPAPTGVYTHVVWDAATLGLTLGQGEIWRIDYVAAVPMNTNELFAAPPPPGSLLQAANIDNNTGPSTQETTTEQGYANYALTTGVYTGDSNAYSDDALEPIAAEDVSIHKSVDGDTIGQGNVDTWTFLVETSEYVGTAGGIVVTDTTPDGLCPLGSGTTEGTAECDFAGEPEPSHPYTSATENPDGTWTLVWDFDSVAGLGAMSRSESRTVTFNTLVREFYQENGTDDTPVLAEDTWSNTVDLVAVADGRDVLDDSSYGQAAPSLSILKEVADDPLAPGQPSPFACGDGTGLLWNSLLGQDYGPGDRACWRLSVFFPGDVDTAGSVITDFVPVGHEFTAADGWQLGPATTAGIVATFDDSDAGSGLLRWTIGDDGGFTDIGQEIEIVYSTTLGAPNDGFPGDLKQNLMKFVHVNSAGAVFPLRDDADAEWAEPILGLVKGVHQVVRAGSVVEGPNTDPDVDGVPVIEADVVRFRLTIDNTGNRIANDIEVMDFLPTGISCTDLVAGSITAPGVCVGAQVEWLGTTGLTVDAGDTLVLEYDVVVPLGISPGLTLTNTAGVRSYLSPTNLNTDFVYVPSDNIDPDVGVNVGPENTSAADDTSSIVTESTTLTKTRTTELAEPGNDADTQAAIGEEITYTITVVVPEGLTVYGPAVVSDSLAPELELVSAQIVAWDGVPADEPTLSVDLAGDVVTATFGDPHLNPVGGVAPGDDTLVVDVVARVADVPSNAAGSAVTNAAEFDYETQDGSPIVDTVAVATDLVEPDIGIAKDENDADDVVRPNETLTYTITISNGAGDAVAHDVVVTDVVPEGLTPSNISDGGTYVADGVPGDGVAGTITWSIPAVNPGATTIRTYEITVDDPVVGSAALTNTARVTASSMPGAVAGERDAGSPNAGTPPSRYEEQVSDTVFGPSLGVTKSVAGSPATIGDDLEYTLTVTVPGGAIVYDATVIDTLPAGIAFDGTASVSCSEAGGDPCSPDIVPVQIGSESAWFLGDLTPSSSQDRIVTIVVDAHVVDPVADGDVESNTVSAYGNTIDRITVEPPATVPDPATFDVTAGPATSDVAIVEPLLTIDKDVVGQVGDTDSRRATPNETLTYRITIENTGTSPAYDVVVTDVVDPRVVAGSIADGVDNGIAWSVTDADPSDGTLGWLVPGPIPVGTSLTIAYDIGVWDATSADEITSGPDLANVADIASYYGVPEPERTANPAITYREYTDVAQDRVDIELDLASIGDRVWFDRNGDGVQDPDEPGLEGVGLTITFYGLDGDPGGDDDEVFTATTGPDGIYVVDHLPGGRFEVTVTSDDLPTGMTATYDLDGGVSTPNGEWVGLLAENDDERDVDFGYNGSGTIGDTVWFDRNGDGVQDPDEPGLEGVTVTVTWLGGDNAAFVVTTDVNGEYEVDGLPPGAYTVEVNPDSLPVGLSPTFDDDGMDTPHSSPVTLGAGEEYRAADFGYNGGSSIGDLIWLDLDGDGMQDVDEPGIPGVIVQLTWPGEDGRLGNGDDEVFITTSDALGNYVFDGLPEGEYRVEVLGGLPAFVDNTFDEDGNGDSAVIVDLTTDDVHDTADFGYQGSTSIGDLVWFDVDNDGDIDAGEPGIAGVEVTLTYAGADDVIGTTDDIVLTMVTNADGVYLFEGLAEGDYIVAVTDGVPPGMVNTFDEDGNLNETTDEFTVLVNEVHLTADFGYTGIGSIGDTIWFDRNGDGVVDPDEPRLPDVGVAVTWAGADGELGTADDVTLTTTTGTDGEYLVTNLPPGDYRVDVDPATLPPGLDPVFDLDGNADNSTELVLADGESRDDVDFGYLGSASLGDTVWFDRNADGVLDPDEWGLGGVVVDATWAGPDRLLGTADDEVFTTTTGADGRYLFDGLPAGQHVVVVDTGTLPPGMAATFDEDGGLDSSIAVTLTAGTFHDTADLGYNGSGSLGDFVWIDRNGDGIQDPDEPGVAGQEVTLVWAGPDGVMATDDDQTYTTLTDADGNYVFDGLPPGDYTVEVTGGIVTAASNSFDEDGDNDSSVGATLADGAMHTTADFGYQGSVTIGDTVWLDLDADGIEDPTEPGIPGVEVVVTWYGPDGLPGGGDDVVFPAVTTDADGFYQLDGLPTGDYGVEVVGGVPAGLANSFDEDGDLDGQTDVTGLVEGDVYDSANFGYSGSGTIGETIWLDLDGDGVQEPGEPGIPSVDVTLTWAGADGVIGTSDDVVLTTTTDATGTYRFENLPAGDFIVEVDGSDLPPGVSATADPDGGADNSSAVTLAAGDTDLDQNFGYRGGSSIGDTVWHDLDGDGVWDIGEPGIEGVTVTVTYHGADGIPGTEDDITIVTTTGADGTYSTEGLPAGDYEIAIDPATLPPGTRPGGDLDGGDPTSTIVSVGVDEEVENVDYPIVGDAVLHGTVTTYRCSDGEDSVIGIGDVVVLITWTGPSGGASIEVTTDATGGWIAPDLPPGSYVVEVDRESLPAGIVTTSLSPVAATLAPGDSETVDLALDVSVDIQARVWIDTDGDGVSDATESGVGGVTVEMRDADGRLVATTTTDTNGDYRFDGVPAGDYVIRLDSGTVPDGLVPTVDPDGRLDLETQIGVGPCMAPNAAAFGFRHEDDLPKTGFNISNLVAPGLLLLVLGTGFVLVSRRRPHDTG